MDSLRRRSNQELSKDMLLEKLVLLTVGYFCIGTELRFMRAKVNPKGEKEKAVSEAWLFKGLYTAVSFLPGD